MKKFFASKASKLGRSLFIITLAVSGLCTHVHAQDISSVMSAYQAYIAQRDAGNLSEAYNTLYSCCQTADPIAQSMTNSSADATKLRAVLTNLLPEIDNAYTTSIQDGYDQNAAIFAQYFLNFETCPVMQGMTVKHSANYPTMVYNTAARTYNNGDFKKVITYFKLYLKSGAQNHRRDVLEFMLDACKRVKDNETIKQYAADFYQMNHDVNLLYMGINACMETGDYEKMQTLVSQAVQSRPSDTKLLKIQGQMYEELGKYEMAIQVYTKLKALSPNDLDVTKHLGMSQYNLAVNAYNTAQASNDKRKAKEAENLFGAAAITLSQVVMVESSSLKYNQALASAYLYSGQKGKMEDVNKNIAALGGQRVQAGVDPTAYASAATANTAATSSNSSAGSVSGAAAKSADIPSYSEFAKKYVEERIGKWQAKDPYETIEEYRARVTEQKRDALVKQLLSQAQSNYIAKYSAGINLRNLFKLCPYDAENKAFLVQSSLGEIIVPVPRDNNEARNFENGWRGMQFSNPQYCIQNDKLALAALTFTTPSGKQYRYSSDKDINYTDTKVDVQLGKIDANLLASNSSGSNTKSKVSHSTVSVGKSDVDKNIPENKTNNDKCFAVVICNENYGNVTAVPMALNDGSTFAEYCEKTLGMPKTNVRLYKDASYGVMLRAVKDIKEIASAYSNDADFKVLFYYAGHGIPNESTKDAYLLPVDADGTSTDGCYSLNKLYDDLGGLGAQQVLVFLDACFSGAKRDGGMLASARGVALKAKKSDPRGNMVIFSAATDDQTAMPYKEKNHGLFTYYLLKKLQESKGNVTLADLGNYITQNVKQKAIVVNKKPQTPTVAPSSSMADKWASIKLIK